MRLEEFDVHMLRGEDPPIKYYWLQRSKANPYVVLRKGHGFVLCGKSKGVKKRNLMEFKVPDSEKYIWEEYYSTWV
jgi:hypothetical protein